MVNERDDIVPGNRMSITRIGDQRVGGLGRGGGVYEHSAQASGIPCPPTGVGGEDWYFLRRTVWPLARSNSPQHSAASKTSKPYEQSKHHTRIKYFQFPLGYIYRKGRDVLKKHLQTLNLSEKKKSLPAQNVCY